MRPLTQYIPSLGTTLFVFGVFLSRDARHLLSTPSVNFLGHTPFLKYLLHNTLSCTVLSLVLYRQSIVSKGLHPVDKAGNPMLYGAFPFAVTMPLLYLVLICGPFWMISLDSRCGKICSLALKESVW